MNKNRRENAPFEFFTVLSSNANNRGVSRWCIHELGKRTQRRSFPRLASGDDRTHGVVSSREAVSHRAELCLITRKRTEPELNLSLGETDWYAVYTKHQHEKSAAASLSSKGMETFVPLHRQTHRWKDRNQVVFVPLFPCYVFVRSNMERKADILRTPGVFWLVGSGGYASRILSQELEAIRIAVNSPKSVEPYPFLQSGDRVRVLSGALSGVEGILVRSKSQHRLVLSVQLLKQSAVVEVDTDMIGRIDEEVKTQIHSRLTSGGHTISGSSPRARDD